MSVLFNQSRFPCDGCTFCCWAYRIEDCPKPNASGYPSTEIMLKMPMEPCPHARTWGCAIHDSSRYPRSCRQFECAWIRQDRRDPVRDARGRPVRIHKPDAFRAAIEETITSKGTIFPAVPVRIPVPEAILRIRDSKAIPDCSTGLFRLQMLDPSADQEFANQVWRSA